MATANKQKKAKEQKPGFFKENTVEIEINGKKTRVNKLEAEHLKKKLAAKAKKAKPEDK